MEENIKIDWNKYFDHIWCIPYISKDRINRYNRLIDELKRVDILDSGIFECIYQVDSKIMNNMYEKAETSYNYNSLDSLNIKTKQAKYTTLNHYKVINISYLLGHKRILILEDDVAFLKDKQKIIDILEKYKNDPIECIKYEGTNPSTDDMELNHGAACYSLTRIGMKKIINNIEGPHMNIIDQYFCNTNTCKESFRINEYSILGRVTIIDNLLNWKTSEKFICLQNYNPHIKQVFANVLYEYNDIRDSSEN